MESLFDETTKKVIEDRIDKLSNTSIPIWGKMNVGQMLSHCQFPLKIALKKEHPPIKFNFLAKLFFKKSMYNDTCWRKNLPTHSKLKVVDNKIFEEEKNHLLELVHEFSNRRTISEWDRHPLFGKFTKDQWGKLQYKHLDHHLLQFKV